MVSEARTELLASHLDRVRKIEDMDLLQPSVRTTREKEGREDQQNRDDKRSKWDGKERRKAPAGTVSSPFPCQINAGEITLSDVQKQVILNHMMAYVQAVTQTAQHQAAAAKMATTTAKFSLANEVVQLILGVASVVATGMVIKAGVNAATLSK